MRVLGPKGWNLPGTAERLTFPPRTHALLSDS